MFCFIETMKIYAIFLNVTEILRFQTNLLSTAFDIAGYLRLAQCCANIWTKPYSRAKEFSFLEQMGNIGSEIERTIRWKEKGNPEYCAMAFERALELLDLTIENTKAGPRLRELTRTREALADHFVFSNEYGTTDELWKKYFFSFAYAAQVRRQAGRNVGREMG
jgi:hypothetical protein